MYCLPFMLEDRGGVVGAGAGLEAPEPGAAGGVVGLELAAVSADEDEVAGGGGGAGVAGLGEGLLPDGLAAGCVDRGEGAACLRPRRRRAAPPTPV